ncbi:DUF2157 domain-containing protein [Ramlibacter albus]|uniref:DUF2157 domain-containing protein n=1 Tax=Ramlibacter albus TaxID=2079448 RepID=A0A923S3Z1_9BURK|nr:DUF2157 domain-containing protein [Ramlibacter albus]MBC5766955.1 DUF2157 domain-containing protein [Ramlibacter albus]
MNLRLALYDWVGRYGLDRARGDALFRIAGYDSEPAAVARRFWPVVAVLAGALAGFGVILWIAANWNDFGRMGRFALLQGALVAFCIGAAWRPRLRAPLALAAMLCIGALFAYFGQTYQTGADTWQLFAVWALLALPLCLGARSDVLWAPWSMVVVAGISAWVHAHIGHRWRVEPQDFDVYSIGWVMAGVLVAALGRGLRRFTGAGIWSLRTAGTLTIAMVTMTAIGGLFASRVAPQFVLALGLLGVAAGVLAMRQWFDVFLLSGVALAIDTLLVAGLVRWIVDSRVGEPIGLLTFIGLFAAGLLAVSVSAITRLARRYG